MTMAAAEPVCANGKTPLEVAREWMDAAARCDLPAIADGMAENCLRYGEPTWFVMEKTGYINAYRQYLISFSDYKLEILNTMTSGTTTVFEMIESATFSQPYPLPDGSVIQPSGETYTDHCCTWIDVGSDGLITEVRAYIPTTRGELMARAIAAMG
jgi:hypothetical protein